MNGSTTPIAAHALAVARLAALSGIEYDLVREAEAKAIGVRVTTLDTEVNRARTQVQFRAGVDLDRPPEYSDDAIALRFTERHKRELRYVAAWGRWLIYRNGLWHIDDTVHAFEKARAICRQAAAACEDLPLAVAIASNKTVAAVEKLARGDQHHAATVDQWDADPWLLNMPKGVVDLRTGGRRDHSADDYMTKITAAPPEGKCPLWLKFLDRVTASDAELQGYPSASLATR